MQRNFILLVACSLAAAPPVAAQTGTPAASATLDARMQALLDEMGEGSTERVAAFFPRRGDWAWVTTRAARPPGQDGTGIWRFPGAETARALAPGGPVCRSFAPGGGELGPAEGALRMHVGDHPSGWRRVRGNRFVPPGAGAGSPVFVQWRREEGAWVVAAFGEAYPSRPRGASVAGTSPVPGDGIVRDTLRVPAGAAYAADAEWYTANRPVTLDGSRYVRYGVPRRLEPGALVRIGTLGRVAVYARPRDTQQPEVVMVPVAPGEFQVYQATVPRSPCGG